MTTIKQTKLTARQQQVLDIIKRKISTKGFPPTRVEIAQELNFRSPNAAEDHLKALARKGYITLLPGKSRGIRLLTPAQDTVQEEAEAQRLPPALLTRSVIGRVDAGSAILAAEHIATGLASGQDLYKQTPDYLLRLRGLSMRDDGILEGDLLAVKKTTEALDGQIVVARIGDEVTVKRLQRPADAEAIILQADNPDYPDLTVTEADEFELERSEERRVGTERYRRV